MLKGMAFAMATCLLLHSFGSVAHAEQYEYLYMTGAAERQSLMAELEQLANERDMMAVVYLSKELELRREPSKKAAAEAVLPIGQTVFLMAASEDANENLWIKVQALMGEEWKEGWLERRYLACSDERFLTWEEAYRSLLNEGKYLSGAAEVSEDVACFPESYQAALMELKKKHPNWIFVPSYVGLDWNEVIRRELEGGRSLVHKSLPACTKEGAYDQGNWFYASKEVLERYMDPRNALVEEAIFQFEQLTFNDSYHTQAALETFLAGTFMSADKLVPGTAMSYPFLLFAIAQVEEVRTSPFHLAARILQEQGAGNSPLISGTYPGYEGYYNYFNIGATGTTNADVIKNGLDYAKENWSNANGLGAYNALLGGAEFISSKYIRKGQDTLYLQKFNVNPNGYYALYNHQYMQNISAPTSEAKSIFDQYSSAGTVNSPFVFKIPVYENMPLTACAMPSSSTNAVLEVPSSFTGTEVIVDGVTYTARNDSNSGKRRLIVTLPDDNGTEAMAAKWDVSTGNLILYRWFLSYANGAYVVGTRQEEIHAGRLDGPEAPQGITAKAPSRQGGTDGKIFGVTVAMEYGTKEDFSDARACTGSEITGLAAGTYYVRFRETAISKAGAAAAVIVEEGKPYVDASAPKLISANAVEQGIQVCWDSNEGVERYMIFRKIKNGKWTRLGDTADNTYTDLTAVAGTLYYYTVRGIDQAGKYVTAYDTTGISATIPVVKTAPKLIGTEVTADGIRVLWENNQGVADYYVFRKTIGGKWNKLGVSLGSEYLDTTPQAGIEYVYTVRGRNGSGAYVTAYDTQGVSAILDLHE